MRNSERGFIALISAVVISAVLILVIAAMSLSSFYRRFAILDAELKQRSAAAADACADYGLLQLALDPSYTGGVRTLNSLDACRIGKIGASDFRVQATSSDSAVTNLKIVYDPGDFSITSWEEIATY